MDNRRTERTDRKCFRCGSEYNIIAKYPNPPRDNEKQKNQVRFSERVNRTSYKECDKVKNNSDQNTYAYMARMSDDDECPSGNIGDSSQLTNWILDSGATCNMLPEVWDFIPGSLEDTDKHIEAADGHHATVKKKEKYK